MNSAKKLATTEKIGILYAPLTDNPYPEELPQKFLASFHFPKLNFSKSLELEETTKVSEAIEVTLKNTHNTLFPKSEPDKFVLKICGVNLVRVAGNKPTR